jgi:hypothetical protein
VRKRRKESVDCIRSFCWQTTGEIEKTHLFRSGVVRRSVEGPDPVAHGETDGVLGHVGFEEVAGGVVYERERDVGERKGRKRTTRKGSGGKGDLQSKPKTPEGSRKVSLCR